jgi:hypothetical protein
MRRLFSAFPSPRPVLLGLVCATLAACVDRAEVTEPGADRASPPPRSAEVPPLLASRRAALVIRNQGCVLLDGDGNVVAADRDFTVVTSSTPRNARITCKARHVGNAAHVAVHYDTDRNPLFPGLLCLVPTPAGGDPLITSDWRETVSASGNATIHCHFKL